jgi:hypothetical protein
MNWKRKVMIWLSRNFGVPVTVYKAVCHNMKSFMQSHKYVLEYSVAYPVYPTLEGSALFAFENYRDAKNAFKWYDIYKAKARISKKIISTIPNIVDDENLEKFWAGKEDEVEGGMNCLPEGTVLCDWIQLTEVVA